MQYLMDLREKKVGMTAGDAVLWVTMCQLECRMKELYGEDYSNLPNDLTQDLIGLINYRSKRELVRTVCSCVEMYTRNQNECPFWYLMRKGRVTASKCFHEMMCPHRGGQHKTEEEGRLCKERRGEAFVLSVEKMLMQFSIGKLVESPAIPISCYQYINHGINHEQVHADLLRQLDPLCHGAYISTGLVLCPDMMILGASPDLVGTRGLMEMKSLPSLTIKTNDTGTNAVEAVHYLMGSKRVGKSGKTALFLLTDSTKQQRKYHVFTISRKSPLDESGTFNITDKLESDSSFAFNEAHKYTQQVMFQRYVVTQTRALSDASICSKDIEEGTILPWIDCGISFLVTYDEEMEYKKTMIKKPAFIIVFDLSHVTMNPTIDLARGYKSAFSKMINDSVFEGHHHNQE